MPNNPVRLLYSLLFYGATPLILARLAWKSRSLPAYRERWRERFACYDFPPNPGVVWFHAVSVGEAEAAFPVIRAFRARYPAARLLVTCTTPTGSARIRAVLADTVSHVYVPYDLPDAVARFLTHVHPVLAVVMETEIWPNLFQGCRQRGIPLAIVNGRLSVKSANGYRRIAGLAAESLSAVSLVAAQTESDATRYIELGASADHVEVVGNVKFDLEFSAKAEAESLRASLFAGRPVWIAGSTHPGEEELLLQALQGIRREIPEALLVLAPRHPERADGIAELFRTNGLRVVRRSETLGCDDSTDVFLLDSLGELRLFYGVADVAFVGGSLVARGGHNVLEPAAAAIPVLFGPAMFNFADIAQGLKTSGGGIEIRDAAELADQVVRLLLDAGMRAAIGNKGQAFIAANRGAVARVIDLLGKLLESHRAQDHRPLTLN